MNIEIVSMVGENCRIIPHSSDKENWTIHRTNESFCNVLSLPQFRSAPHFPVNPLHLQVELYPPFKENFSINGHYGCSRIPPIEFKIEVDLKKIIDCYDEFLIYQNQNTLTNDLKRKLLLGLFDTEE